MRHFERRLRDIGVSIYVEAALSSVIALTPEGEKAFWKFPPLRSVRRSSKRAFPFPDDDGDEPLTRDSWFPPGLVYPRRNGGCIFQTG